MKSHIRKPFDEKMLICGMEDKIGVLEKICRDIGVKSVRVGSGSFNEKVGTLAALESGVLSDGGSQGGNENADECVIFCGFSENKLNRVLKEIRENIPGGIPLKAVLTKANSQMTLNELLGELHREHERLGNKPLNSKPFTDTGEEKDRS